MVLPVQLEHIRERLAENTHELWVMDKIDLGWTNGAVSDATTEWVMALYPNPLHTFLFLGLLIVWFP